MAISDTIPAFPRIIRVMMILRLRGWFTTDSASRVVKPVPENAESAWNFARDFSSPVSCRAIPPMITMI